METLQAALELLELRIWPSVIRFTGHLSAEVVLGRMSDHGEHDEMPRPARANSNEAQPRNVHPGSHSALCGLRYLIGRSELVVTDGWSDCVMVCHVAWMAMRIAGVACAPTCAQRCITFHDSPRAYVAAAIAAQGFNLAA